MSNEISCSRYNSFCQSFRRTMRNVWNLISLFKGGFVNCFFFHWNTTRSNFSLNMELFWSRECSIRFISGDYRGVFMCSETLCMIYVLVLWAVRFASLSCTRIQLYFDLIFSGLNRRWFDKISILGTEWNVIFLAGWNYEYCDERKPKAIYSSRLGPVRDRLKLS